MGYKLENSAFFEKGVLSDEEVFQFVKEHSTVFDRLNPKKMLEMAFIAFTMLQPGCDKKALEGKWKFYRNGKLNW